MTDIERRSYPRDRAHYWTFASPMGYRIRWHLIVLDGASDGWKVPR